MYLAKNHKSPYYQIVYFINGKRTTVSTKENKKNNAEKYLKNFKKSFNIHLELKENTVIPIDLKSFRNEYLKYVKSIRSSSYISSINLSFNQLENYLGNVQLNNIDVRMIDKFITSTFERTHRGAHLYYRTLKAAFTKALLWNYLNENPFKKIKFPKLQKNNQIFITKKEFLLILESTEEKSLCDLYTIAFYTGMRLGEITNMRTSWVDLDKNTITIKNGEGFISKSKRERIIPFNNNLKHILQYYVSQNDNQTNDYIYTKVKGVKLLNGFVSKKFKKTIIKANLNKSIHFHTLRHSFASMLVQKGVSLYVVKELLGHENISTTQIYSHLKQENLEEAIALL
jgi:site-specific recombinase XerD